MCFILKVGYRFVFQTGLWTITSNWTEESIQTVQPAQEGRLMVRAGDELYFYSSIYNKNELYILSSNGLNFELLASFSTDIEYVRVFNDQLYFIADQQLWNVDSLNTVTSVDLEGIVPKRLFLSQDRLLFVGTDSSQDTDVFEYRLPSRDYATCCAAPKYLGYMKQDTATCQDRYVAQYWLETIRPLHYARIEILSDWIDQTIEQNERDNAMIAFVEKSVEATQFAVDGCCGKYRHCCC